MRLMFAAAVGFGADASAHFAVAALPAAGAWARRVAARPPLPAVPDLPPYEASYDIRLIHASESKGPRAATGTFEFRVDRTCDGWETKSHTLIDLTFGDELRATNERFFSSWEAKDGVAYRFAVQTVKNGNTVEAFKGTATVGKGGGDVVYEPLQGPGKQVKLTLPPGTLLPEAHARALVEHAREGDPLFRSVVLSGSSSNGPRIMSIAIGPQLSESAAALPDQSLGQGIDPKLLRTPG